MLGHLFWGHVTGSLTALELDDLIERSLSHLSETLAKTYLLVARSLATLKRTKGFKELGFKTWSAYLEAKSTNTACNVYGKSFAYLLVKLGKAEGLDALLPAEIGGSQLMTYVDICKSPDEIGPLIASTWPEVKDEPVRALRQRLRNITQKTPRRQPSEKASRLTAAQSWQTAGAEFPIGKSAQTATNKHALIAPSPSKQVDLPPFLDEPTDHTPLQNLLHQHANANDEFSLSRFLVDLFQTLPASRRTFEIQLRQFVEDELA